MLFAVFLSEVLERGMKKDRTHRIHAKEASVLHVFVCKF